MSVVPSGYRMMIKRRDWVVALRRLSVVCVLAFYGCGGESDADNASFEQLTLTSWAGFIAPSPDAACDVALADNTFKLNASTRELSWDTCESTPQGEVDHRVGMRALDDAAFAKIEKAYQAVAPSKDPQCVSDAGGIKLDVLKHSEQSVFVDDWTAGCGGGSPSEGVAVTGLSELHAAMAAAR